jgi:hypothetical protein
MSKSSNYPLFPIAPYAGDKSNPPVRSNTGLGVREYFAVTILHALLLEGDQRLSYPDAVKDSVSLADQLLEEIQNQKNR